MLVVLAILVGALARHPRRAAGSYTFIDAGSRREIIGYTAMVAAFLQVFSGV